MPMGDGHCGSKVETECHRRRGQSDGCPMTWRGAGGGGQGQSARGTHRAGSGTRHSVQSSACAPSHSALRRGRGREGECIPQRRCHKRMWNENHIPSSNNDLHYTP